MLAVYEQPEDKALELKITFEDDSLASYKFNPRGRVIWVNQEGVAIKAIEAGVPF